MGNKIDTFIFNIKITLPNNLNFYLVAFKDIPSQIIIFGVCLVSEIVVYFSTDIKKSDIQAQVKEKVPNDHFQPRLLIIGRLVKYNFSFSIYSCFAQSQNSLISRNFL